MKSGFGFFGFFLSNYSFLKAVLILLLASKCFVVKTEKIQIGHFRDNLIENDSSGNQVRCFWLSDSNVYDLNGLTHKNDSFLEVDGGKLVYNFCENTVSKCREYGGSTFYFSKSNSTSCSILTSSAEIFNTWEMIDKSNINSGIKITFTQGEECLPKKNYQLSLEIQCDKQLPENRIEFLDLKRYDNTKCENTLYARSMNACPKVNYYIAWTFINKYFYVFAVLLMIGGIFLNLFGKRHIFGTFFIVSYILMISFVFLILLNRIPGEKLDLMWFAVCGSAFLAGALAYLMYKVESVFFLLVGAYKGYALSLLFYNIMFAKFIIVLSVTYWLYSLLFIIFFAIITFLMRKHVTIFVTAFLGSYCFIRGFSLFVGGMPPESVLFDLSTNREYSQLSQLLGFKVYIYIFVIFLFFIFGLYFQYKFDNEEEKIQMKNASKQPLLTDEIEKGELSKK